MQRKIISLVLAISVMALTLCSCEKDSGVSGNQTNETLFTQSSAKEQETEKSISVSVLVKPSFEAFIERRAFSLRDFNEGLAAIRQKDEWGDYKWGCIDKKGRVIVPFQYDYMGDFSDGLAVVRKDEKYGFVDKTGKEVIPVKYSYAESFDKGIALVAEYDEWGDYKWGCIDKNGKNVSYKNDSLSIKHKEDSNKCGFVDFNGNLVIPYEYDEACNFIEDLAAVKKDDKWGFIDKKGNVIVRFIYDEVDSFSEGLAAVKKDDKWGYIDKTGKVVIPIKYDYLYNFSEGLAAVLKDGKYGFIDKQDKLIVPCEFDIVQQFHDGMAWVAQRMTDEESGEETVKWGILQIDN